jgi:hypothetical protein
MAETAPYAKDASGPAFTDHIHPWMTTVQDLWDHRTINMYAFPAGWTQDSPAVAPPPATPPTVSFPMVPEGLTFLRSADFEIDACDPLTFNVATPVADAGAPAGTNFQRISAASFSVNPRRPHGHVWLACGNRGRRLRAWTAMSNGRRLASRSTPRRPKPKAAIAMVLDQSNSMTFDSGSGRTSPRGRPPFLGAAIGWRLDEDHAMLVDLRPRRPSAARATVADAGAGSRSGRHRRLRRPRGGRPSARRSRLRQP